MDIGSLDSSYINNLMNNASDNKTSVLSDKLKNTDVSKASDDELMEVCKEFEAYFYEQIFKNMKSSMVPSSEESSGAMSTLKGFYEDELTKEYAKGAADQSTNGLAQMLYEQMKRNYSQSTD
ncbi:MAG: rod-binding protein [Lachnospiraceae bacterium]|nr:rod-binding protein [Lachnospiraceae bacterium]